MIDQDYWVYILQCENNTYYTGYTNDLAKRYQAHMDGVGSKYTRSFKPLKIAQSWEIHGGKALAMAVERYIKTLSRREKEEIVADPSMIDAVVLTLLKIKDRELES
ncbi:MAG: GIY-YIG nuclease family protein [Gammaproteobacteria bacterium]|nr:GIY-YIG nuclease family protein [Gammaproteobacteria bacterium]